MILTGRAAEYVEGFEQLDKMLSPNLIELDENAQIDLFQITMLYERDEGFHFFARGCLALYTAAVLKGKPTIAELLGKFQTLLGETQEDS